MRSKRGPRYERADNEQQEVWPPGDARDRHTCPLQKGDARPLNEHPKDQNPRLHNLETGRSRRRDPRDRGAKKARRVSQRRELVVVTLGAVASIAGLGGFAARNPPGWVTTPQNTAPETVATLELEPDGEAPGDEGTQLREAGADSNPAGVEPAPMRRQEEFSETPTEQDPPAPPASSQGPAEEEPPAWSAPSRGPAAAESRGS